MSANGSMSIDLSGPTLVASRTAEACLRDAAARGEVVEVVVVLRGRLRERSRRADGSWSVRLQNGHYRAFSPESVIAVTPVAKRAVVCTAPARESTAGDASRAEHDRVGDLDVVG